MSLIRDGGGEVSAVTATATTTATATRRVPPPCWTDEETLALVNAYRDKWFALRRGNLRQNDWDAVAAAVSSSSSSATPKSSIQCRHKIEKLRKRYRAEKLRCLNKPGKFVSSWDLFPLLDAMGFVSTTPPVAQEDDENDGFKLKFRKVGGFGDDGFDSNVDDGFRLKSRKVGSFDDDLNSNMDLGNGFGIKGGNRVRGRDYVNNFNAGDVDVVSHGFGGGLRLKRKYDGNLKGDVDFDGEPRGAGFGVRVKDEEEMFVPKGSGVNPYAVPSVAYYGHGGGGGFPVRTSGGKSSMAQRLKLKNYGNCSPSLDYGDDVDDMTPRGNGFRERASSEWDSVPLGVRANGYDRADEGFTRKADFKVFNGFGSSSRSGYVKSTGNASKGQPHLVEEVVSSVKMLTEMFVRMEKTKIEVLREMEKKRMEMELKHTQMMLESQQQIVNVFSEALREKKNKKMKAKLAVPPSINGDSDEGGDV